MIHWYLACSSANLASSLASSAFSALLSLPDAFFFWSSSTRSRLA